VAKEVCEILGLKNSRSSLALLDDDEKNTVHIVDGKRGNPVKTIVNEPGLYSLILRSHKPQGQMHSQDRGRYFTRHNMVTCSKKKRQVSQI
jgi:prophage antirepressor-like protein